MTQTDEKPTEPTVAAVVEEAKEAAESLLVSVAPTIFTGISFAQLVLFVVGTAVPWFFVRTASSSTYVSLWKIHTDPASGPSTDIFVQDMGTTCQMSQDYFKGAEAFAIISIFAALFAFLAGLAARFSNSSIRVVGALLSIVTFAVSIVAWGIMVRAYYLSFCNSPSLRDQHYYVYAGPALFITGWVLSFVNLIVAIQDPKVPPIIPDALADRFAATVFTLLAVVAFVFTVIGTPISIFSSWTAGNTEVRVTEWAYNTYVDGSLVSTFATSTMQTSCGDMYKYFRFGQAFALLSILVSLIAVVVGVLSVSGTSGKKGAIIAGFFAAVSTLIKFAADLQLYYGRFCDTQVPLSEAYYHLDAGFALFVAAFAGLLAGVILLVIIGLAQLCSNAPVEGNTRFSAFLFIIGTTVSITFMAIALTQPVFSQTQGSTYTHVNWWRIVAFDNGVYTNTDFVCKSEWERLVGGGSLGIIAIGLSLIVAFIGFAQLSSGNLRNAASYTGLFVSIIQLVAWGLAVSDYWGQFCSGTSTIAYPYYNNSYNIASGLGLMIAAWATNFVVSILNLLVAPQ